MKTKYAHFFKNLNKEKWLIMLCLIMGFLSWQGIQRNIGFKKSVSNITVAIEVPDSWAVLEKSVHHVTVLFRGSNEDLRYLNKEQLQVVIPITKPTPGKPIQFKLTEKYLRNSTGAKVIEFSPDIISITLEQEKERFLPVKASVAGTLPEGFEIDRIICTPASVRVSGAQQILDEIKNIHTEPVDLKNRQSTFKESVTIALPPSGRMKVDPNWVSVQFIVVQRSHTQEFKEIPVRILREAGDSRNITITPKFINLTIKGEKERIEKFALTKPVAYVKCTELYENTGYDLPISIDLPEKLQLIKTDPPVIHINITPIKLGVD